MIYSSLCVVGIRLRYIHLNLLHIGESFNEIVYNKKKRKMTYDSMLEAVRNSWRDKYSEYKGGCNCELDSHDNTF